MALLRKLFKKMKSIVAQIDNPFGEISPPPGMDIGSGDPVVGVGQLLGWGINIFIIIAGMFMLVYLLWGAFDWISSSGEKEKLSKAQNKITNALVGMLVVFIVLVVFNVFAGRMLKIVRYNSDGTFDLKIPFLQ